MRKTLLLLSTMAFAVVLVSGVAYALTVQCDVTGDQDPDPGGCLGATENDVIIGTAQRDDIVALDGLDDVTARGGDDKQQSELSPPWSVQFAAYLSSTPTSSVDYYPPRDRGRP